MGTIHYLPALSLARCELCLGSHSYYFLFHLRLPPNALQAQTLGSSSLSHQNPLPHPLFIIPSHDSWGWREGGVGRREVPSPALPQLQGQTHTSRISLYPPLSPTLPQVRQMGVEVTFFTSGSGPGALGEK